MGREVSWVGAGGTVGKRVKWVFWKEEKTKASDWGCLPIDGFLTWALRWRRTDVGLPSSISGARGTLRRHRLSWVQ